MSMYVHADISPVAPLGQAWGGWLAIWEATAQVVAAWYDASAPQATWFSSTLAVAGGASADAIVLAVCNTHLSH